MLVPALGFYVTFLAPMLHVFLDYKIAALSNQPEDFRPWFTRLGYLNIVGLGIFMLICSNFMTTRARTMKPIRAVHRGDLLTVGSAAITLSILLQIYIYASFGGIAGYVDKYLNDASAWENMGGLMMISESAPMTVVIVLAGLRQRMLSRRSVSRANLIVAALIFLGAQFVFGGLRGSRSHIIVTMFYAASLTHELFRPISRNVLIVGAITLVSFTYFYTFFKDWGFEGTAQMFDPEARADMSRRSGRSIDQLLLSDFNRSDIQAFVLQELAHNQVNFAFGRTYIGALSPIVPRAIWPERLPTKSKWTTDLEDGEGSYEETLHRTSRMYGQVGEAMLNFGYLGLPLAYAFLGLIVGKISNLFDTLSISDARRLFLPGLTICSIYMFVQDSDNILYFLIKYVGVPFVIVALSSLRTGPNPATFSDNKSLLTQVPRIRVFCQDSQVGVPVWHRGT